MLLQTKKQVQRFMGMANFYRRILLGIARHLVPLHEPIVGSQKDYPVKVTPSFT